MVFQPTIIVQGGGGTDVSATTATEADVLDGEIFYKADGTQAEGTAELFEDVITTSTTDLEDGVSSLTTGTYYFVIEE